MGENECFVAEVYDPATGSSLTYSSERQRERYLWPCQFEAASDGNGGQGGLMRALRPITMGEEIVHAYNDNPSACMWSTYGFLPGGDGVNPFESAWLEFPLLGVRGVLQGDSDQLQSLKLNALEELGYDISRQLIF